MTGYAASKAAEWSMSNALRVELRPQGIQVIGVHCGFVDTESTKDIKANKVSLDLLVQKVIEGIQENLDEVLVDAYTRKIKASLYDDQHLLYATTN